MDTAAPRVSILIVSWNASAYLRRFLPSVAATDYPNFELILVDNASTDDSVSWVRACYPEVRIIEHPENWAFCRGYNEAIVHADGSYLVLLNNDVEVPSGWLQPLVRAMEADPRLAAVQPKMLQEADHGRFEYAGACGGFLDRYGYPFARGRIFSTLESDRGQYDTAVDVFWATGAALMIRKSVIDAHGLFDERFYMHMEEIDFCWRVQRAGYRVGVVPASQVFHLGGGSLPQGNARKTYFNFRNNLLTLYKHLPPRRWRRTLGMRILLDSLAAARALFTGGLREAAAIVRAYRDGHRMCRAYASERPKEAESIPLPYRGSIVADYFIRKKRVFTDLRADRFLQPGSTSPAREPR